MVAPRTVVCDLGGVVLRWDPLQLVRHVLAARGGAPASAEQLMPLLFQEFTPDSDWSQFDRGSLDEAGLVTRIAGRTGIDAGFVGAILTLIPAHLRPDPAMLALLAALRAAGHRLVYLSNMPAPFADRLEADAAFRGWFDAGVFSCRVLAVKPEPEIFRIAAARLDLDPARLVMVDDRVVNLEQAERFGWAGVLFTDAARCRDRLAELGWL